MLRQLEATRLAHTLTRMAESKLAHGVRATDALLFPDPAGALRKRAPSAPSRWKIVICKMTIQLDRRRRMISPICNCQSSAQYFISTFNQTTRQHPRRNHGTGSLGDGYRLRYGESARRYLLTWRDVPSHCASEPYPLYHPHAGWAEQQPDEWWQSLETATRRFMQQSGVAPESIAGLSADRIACTVVMMDEAFARCGRAII